MENFRITHPPECPRHEKTKIPSKPAGDREKTPCNLTCASTNFQMERKKKLKGRGLKVICKAAAAVVAVVVPILILFELFLLSLLCLFDEAGEVT